MADSGSLQEVNQLAVDVHLLDAAWKKDWYYVLDRKYKVWIPTNNRKIIKIYIWSLIQMDALIMVRLGKARKSNESELLDDDRSIP